MGILLHMEKELENYQQKKGERRDMCEAIKAMIEEGRIETTIEMCQEFQVSKESTLERIEKEFSLGEEEAKKYMEEYWK